MLGLLAMLGAASAPFVEDFEKMSPGKVPDTIQVMDGDFSIRDVDGNRCLELAGTPLGGFGAQIGPSGLTACDVSARIWAAPSGKRYPEFGISADGAGGPRLMIEPAVNAITVRLGDNTIATSSFAWKASTWTFARLQVWTHDGKWYARCKAWNTGDKEPAQWMIDTPLAKAPSAGRASVWGSDYSEQPIRFDDITVKGAD